MIINTLILKIMKDYSIRYYYGDSFMWETHESSTSESIKRKYINRILNNEIEGAFVITECPYEDRMIIIRRWFRRDERGFILSGNNLSVTEHYRIDKNSPWLIRSDEERCSIDYLNKLQTK